MLKLRDLYEYAEYRNDLAKEYRDYTKERIALNNKEALELIDATNLVLADTPYFIDDIEIKKNKYEAFCVHAGGIDEIALYFKKTNKGFEAVKIEELRK